MTGFSAKLLSATLSVILMGGALALPAFAVSADEQASHLEVLVIPAEGGATEQSAEKADVITDQQAEENDAAPEKSRMLAVKEVVLPDGVQAAGAATMAQAALPESMVVDNDEYKAAAVEEFSYKEIADAPDKTFIQTGARFPVYMSSTVTSKTAKVGDPVEGRLKVDLKIGGRLVAPKGSIVIGHITKVYPARKMIFAELVLNKRWMRMAGSLSFNFDEIVTPESEHLPLVAAPATQARIIKNTNEGRVLGVNRNNEIASPLSTQLKHQALHLAVRAGAACGGVFTMGAVPVAYGVIGAINPSFAFMQPVGKNMRHRRLKAFALGILTGLPGGFLISDSIIRGPEAVVKPGDIFQAELKQDFTGEAATSAQLMPGATTKVHGEQIKTPKKKK